MILVIIQASTVDLNEYVPPHRTVTAMRGLGFRILASAFEAKGSWARLASCCSA